MKRTMERMVLYIGGLLVAAAPYASGSEDAGTIRLNGCRIKAADHVTLAVNQSGVLNSVPKEGDQVEAGQQVILLDDELARASLTAADKEAANDAEIRYAESGSEAARQEHEQAIKVNETVKGSLPISDVRRRKLEWDQNLLRIELARYKQAVALSKRDEAAAQLKAFHVVAPFTGTVNRVLKYKGETVRQGDPILELVNTRRVRVEGYLDVGDRRRVTAGIPVYVVVENRTGEGTSSRLIGKVVFVDTVVQPVTQQVRIWADVENDDEILLPGLTAVMTILPASPLLTTSHR